MTAKKHRENIWREGNVLYLASDRGYMSVYIRQNSSMTRSLLSHVMAEGLIGNWRRGRNNLYHVLLTPSNYWSTHPSCIY